MEYEKAKYGTYYGMELYYRLEFRRSGVVIRFSVRTPDGKHILYQHPPRRIQELTEFLAAEDEPDRSILEQLPEKYMDDFFRGLLGADPNDQTSAFKAEDLPLAAIIAGHRKELLQPGNRTAETVADDERGLREIVDQIGRFRWEEITPEGCQIWLKELTPHRRTVCLRMLRKISALPLLGTTPADRQKWDKLAEAEKKSRRNPAFKPVSDTVYLTDEQASQLLQIRPGKTGRISGVSLALVLKLVLGLSDEKLCGLNLEDIQPLPGSSRLTMHICRTFSRVPNGKNYRLRPMDGRVLPLPLWFRDLWEKHLEYRKPIGETPLLTDSNCSRNRMNPRSLHQELRKTLASIGEKLPYQALETYAGRKLKDYGCPEREICWLFGKKSPASQEKFSLDAETLEWLGRLMDEWKM